MEADDKDDVILADAATRDRWIKRLARENSAHKEWRDQAEAAQAAYFAERPNAGETTTPTSGSTNNYPLFWPTVKVLHARIYSQPPKPDVRKRYQDSPGVPIPAQAPGMPPPVDDNKIAQAVERALSYTIDTTDFDADGHAAVNDLLVAGLGSCKVELETETDTVPVLNPMTGMPIMDEAGNPVMKQVIRSQKVKLRHFSWSQFRWEPQQHWSNVSWVAFDHWMTKDELEDQFAIEISAAGASGPGTGGRVSGSPKPAADKYKALFCVHEIWDKEDRKRLFITDAWPLPLAVDDDPLGLEGFFPCPKPMMTNVRGEDLLPKPDYTYCEPQFRYVNDLSGRIIRLTKQIKHTGFYDASFGELANINSSDDGDLVPITNLAAKIEAVAPGKGGGYDAIIATQDNTPKAMVVQELMQLREQAKQVIWETYGISDIQRGSTKASETATAQEIKAQWADIRVGERVRIVSLFFRDVFRIMAEIIAEHFQPQTFEAMTGFQMTPDEMELLRSDLGRCYAIDVESDSTVVQDEFAQKQQRMEFLTSVTGYLKEILPAVQSNVMPADLAKELLLFMVNTFKNGRQLEQTINALPGSQQQLAQLQQQAQQSQQQAQQAQQAAQQAQAQLQKVNAGKEQRENVKTSVDAQKTAAETARTQVETAEIAQDVRSKAMQPIPMH